MQGLSACSALQRCGHVAAYSTASTLWPIKALAFVQEWRCPFTFVRWAPHLVCRGKQAQRTVVGRYILLAPADRRPRRRQRAARSAASYRDRCAHRRLVDEGLVVDRAILGGLWPRACAGASGGGIRGDKGRASRRGMQSSLMSSAPLHPHDTPPEAAKRTRSPTHSTCTLAAQYSRLRAYARSLPTLRTRAVQHPLVRLGPLVDTIIRTLATLCCLRRGFAARICRVHATSSDLSPRYRTAHMLVHNRPNPTQKALRHQLPPRARRERMLTAMPLQRQACGPLGGSLFTAGSCPLSWNNVAAKSVHGQARALVCKGAALHACCHAAAVRAEFGRGNCAHASCKSVAKR